VHRASLKGKAAERLPQANILLRKQALRRGQSLPREQSRAAAASAADLDVVVKVQHPGIESVMRDDLFNLGILVKVVAYFEPDFDFRPVLDEWA